MRDGTSEDSATQLLICEPLSFAISPGNYKLPSKQQSKLYQNYENIGMARRITVNWNSNGTFVFWNQNRLSKCSNKERITMSGEDTCYTISWTIRKGLKQSSAVSITSIQFQKIPPFYAKTGRKNQVLHNLLCSLILIYNLWEWFQLCDGRRLGGDWPSGQITKWKKMLRPKRLDWPTNNHHKKLYMHN